VPNLSLFVHPARKFRAEMGSKYGWSSENGLAPVEEYGYFESMLRGITIWSLTHPDSYWNLSTNSAVVFKLSGLAKSPLLGNDTPKVMLISNLQRLIVTYYH
tara:strand:- start:332 stop:637 length:306 start_codon:yes stop_codon:yes gene_type:complete